MTRNSYLALDTYEISSLLTYLVLSSNPFTTFEVALDHRLKQWLLVCLQVSVGHLPSMNHTASPSENPLNSKIMDSL